MTYPTWTQISPTRWESAERVEGIPDFVAECRGAVWFLKWRTSQIAQHGFASMDEVRAVVQRDLDQHVSLWIR